MNKWKKLLVALVIGSLGLSGCVADESLKETQTPGIETQAPTPEETLETKKPNENNRDDLVVAMNPTQTFNPLKSSDMSVQQTLYLIFSPLVNIEDNGNISGALAESWMVNPNHTVVTITLRQDAAFHDGQAVTSDDVLFTLEQIQKIGDSPYKETVENISSVERVDDKTFKIVYKQPFSSILQTLAFPVIPKHVYESLTEEDKEPMPIGSGPYKVEQMAALKELQLTANESYFKGVPKIKKIKIKMIPDEESRLYAFKQGLIDVIYTKTNDWGKYTSQKANTAYKLSSNVYEFIGLNLNRGLFQSENIRKALVYGVNREELVHLYCLDHAIVTDTPISPNSYLYDKSLELLSYDKEKAKYLLTEEGYVKSDSTGIMTKNGTPFSFTLLVNVDNTERVKVAAAIQKMYQELGIQMNIEKVDNQTYLERIKGKNFEAFLGAFQMPYATDLSFALNSASVVSGENYIGYQDEKMDQLLKQAFIATSEKMPQAYNKLQEYFVEKMPYVSLYFKNSVLMTQNDLKGITASPTNVYAYVENWTR